MIDAAVVGSFLARAGGQALKEGNRYALEARVGDLIGSGESVATVVRGHTGDYEVALWAERGSLAHRCSCPSWRDPCKHQVAAALVLRQQLLRVPVVEDRSRRPAGGGPAGATAGKTALRAGPGAAKPPAGGAKAAIDPRARA